MPYDLDRPDDFDEPLAWVAWVRGAVLIVIALVAAAVLALITVHLGG